MECKYCHKEIPDDAKYCHLCGKQQIVQPKRHRRHRPQSQGSIVKLSGGHRENPYWARYDPSTGMLPQQYIGNRVNEEIAAKLSKYNEMRSYGNTRE